MKTQCAARPARRQQGIVLIIAMILLIVISLISIASVRSAGSSELAANNARVQNLAMQAAETALQYCETGVLNHVRNTGTYKITPETQPEDLSKPYRWQDVARWDAQAARPELYVLSSGEVNKTSGTHALYKRYPECMAQYQFHPASSTKSFVVTARGFGPDVEADQGDANRKAPNGAEVWLQSTLSTD